MLPIAMAILTFFVVEGIFLQTIYNLEAGFLPGISLGILVAIATEVWLIRMDGRLYNPEPDYFEVSMPRAFTVVKRVLKTYCDGTRRWRLNYDDKLAGEIQASMQFVDDGYSDMRWLVPSGRLERTILLQAWVTTDPDFGTRIELAWSVHSPLSRTDCNAIVRETTAEILAELAAAGDSQRTGPHTSAKSN